MARTTYSTIQVRPNLSQGLRPAIDQYKQATSGAISPGHLVDLSSGEVIKFAGAAGTNVQLRLAVEKETHDWRSDQDDAVHIVYKDGEQVRYIEPVSGDVVIMRLKNAETVAVDGMVETAVGGEVQARTTGDAIGYAMEAKTGVADVKLNLLKVRVK